MISTQSPLRIWVGRRSGKWSSGGFISPSCESWGNPSITTLNQRLVINRWESLPFPDSRCRRQGKAVEEIERLSDRRERAAVVRGRPDAGESLGVKFSAVARVLV